MLVRVGVQADDRLGDVFAGCEADRADGEAVGLRVDA